MPKKIIKKIMPDKNNKLLKMFGDKISPELFTANRKKILLSVFIGVFISFLPIPFQMGIIGFFAILLKVNLPIAVILAWISNPLTMPVIFFAEYKLGSFIINGTPLFEFSNMVNDFSLDKIHHYLMEMFLGAFIFGAFFGILSVLIVSLIWKFYVLKKRRVKLKKYKKRKK